MITAFSIFSLACGVLVLAVALFWTFTKIADVTTKSLEAIFEALTKAQKTLSKAVGRRWWLFKNRKEPERRWVDVTTGETIAEPLPFDPVMTPQIIPSRSTDDKHRHNLKLVSTSVGYLFRCIDCGERIPFAYERFWGREHAQRLFHRTDRDRAIAVHEMKIAIETSVIRRKYGTHIHKLRFASQSRDRLFMSCANADCDAMFVIAYAPPAVRTLFND